MNEEQMKKRTKEFAKEIIKLCRKLPNNREGRLIGAQIFRSGTSVASNYRAAYRARPTAELISKLSIVEKEVDETFFWFKIINEMKTLKSVSFEPMMEENDEIMAIIVGSIKTARKNNRVKP